MGGVNTLPTCLMLLILYTEAKGMFSNLLNESRLRRGSVIYKYFTTQYVTHVKGRVTITKMHEKDVQHINSTKSSFK